VQSTLASEAQRLLDDYLRRLDRALRSVPEPERDEIRVEIESHLRGMAAALPQPVEVDDVLDMLYKLGEPESYVPLYLTESYLSKGFRRASPLMLARGVARWLASTALGYLYSFPFFLLYLISFFSLAMGMLKLIFPQHVGIAYLSDEGPQTEFWFGFTSYTHDPSKGHELLGFWTVPFVWGLGLLTALGATSLLRWMTRQALRKRFGSG
jgi:uncharacterized membrane protein